MDLCPGRPLSKNEIVRLLEDARARTLQLIAPLTGEDLTIQHSPLMSPIIWDLGHIAHFEEVWMVERGGEGRGGEEGLRGIYNPFDNPRAGRTALDLPDAADTLRYLAEIRSAALASLEGMEPSEGDPLLRDGFVFRMVLQHEYQHNETILQTLQLKQGTPYPAPSSPSLAPGCSSEITPGEMVRFPGARVRLGTDDTTVAYDNERPAHEQEIEPFLIDRTPVTNQQMLDFIEDGGYSERSLWTEEGWSWRATEDARAPAYWTPVGEGGWSVRTMDRVTEVEPLRPVCHVSYHEANAFARWAGKRLPSESEWEAAALWDPEAGVARRFPWGDDPPDPTLANLDARHFGPLPVGTFPDNRSPIGCHGMIGDVWEWTSSDFVGYPGFVAFPYPEYSEVFFGGEYKVLRGGSWATRPGAIRGTFRNWDYPIRRQIFSGFRCARDDE